MSKRYYWLKLKDDFFSSIKIKKLRKTEDGNLLTIIYLKMQLLSVKNGGTLSFEGVESSFEEELALALDEDVDSVRTTLLYLQNLGMIQHIGDDEYLIPDVAKNVGSESDSAARMRKIRDKGTADKETPSHCDADVRGSDKNVTLDIERDKEKDRDIEIDTEKDQEQDTEKDRDTEGEGETPQPIAEDELPLPEDEQKFENPSPSRPDGRPPAPKIPYSQVQQLYNDTCTNFPRCQSVSEGRKRAIRARFREGKGLEDFRRLFEKAEASRFLRGDNPRGWKANFDWLIKDANMLKVLEGSYDDQQKGGNNNGYGTYPQTARPDPAGGFEEIPGGLRL